jgi:hypothetical protein
MFFIVYFYIDTLLEPDIQPPVTSHPRPGITINVSAGEMMQFEDLISKVQSQFKSKQY